MQPLLDFLNNITGWGLFSLFTIAVCLFVAKSFIVFKMKRGDDSET